MLLVWLTREILGAEKGMRSDAFWRGLAVHDRRTLSRLETFPMIQIVFVTVHDRRTLLRLEIFPK